MRFFGVKQLIFFYRCAIITKQLKRMPLWWNWQTRGTQNPVLVTTCGFDSHQRHHFGGRDREVRSRTGFPPLKFFMKYSKGYTNMNFETDIFTQYDKKWALLTSGTENDFNTMTISWGGMGTLWGKPVVTVYVRPNRYTYSFLEKNDLFTVSFYPENYKKDLGLLGKLSGREGNKIKKTSLTPVCMAEGVMTFRQAETTFVCKKLYAQDLDGDKIPQEIKDRFYQGDSVHRMYIAEFVDIIQ